MIVGKAVSLRVEGTLIFFQITVKKSSIQRTSIQITD